MFHFKTLLIMTTLCLSLASNALPVGSPRQVDAAHDEVARNVVPGIVPRNPKGISLKPPPKPAAPKPPPAPKVTAAKTTAAVKTTAVVKTTASSAKPSVVSTSSSVVVPPKSSSVVSSSAKSSSPVASSTVSSVTSTSSLATSRSSVLSSSSSVVASSSSSLATSRSSALSTSSSRLASNASSTLASVTASSTLVPSARPTTNGTQSGNSTSCALPPKPVVKTPSTSTKLSTRAMLALNRLLGRDNEEFVGFHGTNSATAAFWASQGGKITKPPGNTGILDFLGLTSTGSGTSGADAELGPGLYVADEPVIAQGFANGNAVRNPGTTAMVCAIFASSSGNWRSVIPKVFVPQNLVGDSSTQARAQQLENNRLTYIKDIGVSPTTSAASNVVKFSLLGVQARTGQMSIPSSITNQFIAKCFPAATDPATALPGQLPNPLSSFQFDSQTLRTEWNIHAENQAVANSILAGCSA